MMSFSEPTSHSVNSNGCAINLRRWASAATDAPSSRPPRIALLVHGFLAHAQWWDHIAPHLTRFDSVLAMDLSGMGDSGHRASYHVEDHVQELLDCLNYENGSARCSLIGHSFGGGVAVVFADRYPERLNELIVLDSLFRLQPKQFQPGRQLTGRSYPNVEEALKRFRLLPDQPFVRPEIVDRVARQSLRTTEDGRVAWKFDQQRDFASASANDMWNQMLTRFQAIAL